MYGDNIIKEYKGFASLDRGRYKGLEEYIKPHLTDNLQKALLEILSVYNSIILQWERFNEHIKTRNISVNTSILNSAEKAIYTAVDNGKQVSILDEIEKAFEDYRQRLIRKGASKNE